MLNLILMILNALFGKKAQNTSIPTSALPTAAPSNPPQNPLKISIEELLGDQTTFEELSKDIQDNLKILQERVCKIRELYGKPMRVTSGLRSMKKHLAIYAAKGITDTTKIPMQSRHLYGQAVDVSDSRKDLQSWCMANVKALEEIGLWCESFDACPNWVHFQCVPPKSGNRFFKP